MPTYALQMNGQNFLIEMDGKNLKHGFYQNFILQGKDEEEVELKAAELIRSSKELQNMTLNEEADPPMIFLDEIDELVENEPEDTSQGRVWYCEEETEK